MKICKRKKSLITNKSNLKLIYKFDEFPAYIGCTDKPQKRDLFADLDFWICKDSGMVQVGNLLPLNIVYPQFHSEALGRTWENHLLSFIELLIKYNPKKILEIGGSSGFLAKKYMDFDSNVNWTIIETNPNIKNNNKIKVIRSVFDSKMKVEKIYDAVVHSHVFEHIYDPSAFLRKIRSIQYFGDLMIFSIPNLLEYLKNNYSNCLNFEHTFFLTEEMADYLIRKYGYELLEKKYYLNHSIFYVVKKVRRTDIEVINKYFEYDKLFNDYISYYQKLIIRYNSQINKFNGIIFIFGAHVFSQLLINMGLEIEKCIGILDNSTIKHGKRLYGTKLLVYSPNEIINHKNVAVILNAGAYQEEIKQQLKNLKTNILIIE